MFFLATSILLLSTSCYYDNKEDLYLIVEGGECNTTNITYTSTVQSIIENQCISCHKQGNASGNVALDNYTKVKQYAENGLLMGSIRHESGYSAMPPGGSLSNCNIQQLEAWIAAGSPEN